MTTPSTSPFTIDSVSVRLATPDDAGLPCADNTKLVALNTCPTWGILRYDMHKTFSSEGRAMALEAGKACHDVFAALRLWQLWHHDPANARSPLHGKGDAAFVLYMQHGIRLFGEDRFKYMCEQAADKANEDDRTQSVNFCLAALETSGFYDDERDKRRTMTNLEEACITYIDRWRHEHPIWIRDANDPASDVGIEIAFDLVVEMKVQHEIPTFLRTANSDVSGYWIDNFKARFTGKLDGIHLHTQGVGIEENKTGSRLDEAWRQSFTMSSQVTGYCVAASTFIGLPVRRGIVRGLALPQPRAMDNGIVNEPVTRDEDKLIGWFNWFYHTMSLLEDYKDNPIDAPRYTHSCNRYFRPCSFIPFCDTPREDQASMIEDMATEEWSPLNDIGASD